VHRSWTSAPISPGARPFGGGFDDGDGLTLAHGRSDRHAVPVRAADRVAHAYADHHAARVVPADDVAATVGLADAFHLTPAHDTPAHDTPALRLADTSGPAVTVAHGAARADGLPAARGRAHRIIRNDETPLASPHRKRGHEHPSRRPRGY
jgi:hypothetical protein